MLLSPYNADSERPPRSAALSRNYAVDAPFPLTLALSLRERERPSPRWDELLSGEILPAWPSVLPLPKGEGPGEGESGLELNSCGFRLQRREAGGELVDLAMPQCNPMLLQPKGCAPGRWRR